jgi:hypothetical protein
MQYVTEVIVSFGVIWIDSKCLPVMRDRLFQSVESMQRVAQIVMRVRMIRPDGKRLLEVGNRCLGMTSKVKDDAEVVVSIDMSRRDLEGAAKMRDRLVVTVECEHVVGIGRALVYPDRSPKLRRSIIVSALLQTQEAETVQSTERRNDDRPL